jgi:hypothetical protein
MPERRGVRSFEIHALIALDSADAALKAIDDAILLPEERDVSGSVVTTLATASIEFDAHGNERAASRVRERANAVVLGMSDTERMRFVASLAALGHDSLVLRLAPQFLAADSATFGTRASYAIALINKGDTAGALREISAIERVGSRLRPYVSGADLLARARVAAALGRGSEALSLASQAIAQGQGFNARRQIHAGEEFRSLRNTPEFQKLMRPRDD